MAAVLTIVRQFVLEKSILNGIEAMLSANSFHCVMMVLGKIKYFKMFVRDVDYPIFFESSKLRDTKLGGWMLFKLSKPV